MNKSIDKIFSSLANVISEEMEILDLSKDPVFEINRIRSIVANDPYMKHATFNGGDEHHFLNNTFKYIRAKFYHDLLILIEEESGYVYSHEFDLKWTKIIKREHNIIKGIFLTGSDAATSCSLSS